MLKKAIVSILLSLPLLASSVLVSVVKPVKEKIDITVDATGTVQAKNTISITAKTNGVLKLFVSNDSFVKRGDMIAQVVDMPRKNKIQLLKKELNLLKNELQLQKNRVTRLEDKYKMGVGSKNGYLSETIVLKQLKQQQVTIENEYETLLLEETNSKIVAPRSGVLINLQADGSYINYGSSIATLIDDNSLVKLFVDSAYVTKIKNGMDVKIFSSYKNCDAKIVNTLPRSSNNLIEVLVKPSEKLPLNLQINAKIILQKYLGTIIPKEAIVLVDNHPAIYLIDDKNITHLFFIDIQKDMIDKALIKNTLPENAKIALKNAYMLHDNLRVEVINDAK